ncbi:MAG: Bro-N domain-containing protein [Gammaproteobacteria bacterium]|nr:Bro-N domain-containing protein [Gammaproteobacteria bacterium]
MSNELISFEFESTSSSIRVVEIDGELWFVAKDVAEALEYVWNGTECVRHVPEKWRGVRSVLTPSGLQEMVVLAEQGLYFFVLRSDKPKAFPFQEWLAGDVLPALRQRGHYGLPNHSERLRYHTALSKTIRQLEGTKNALSQNLLIQQVEEICSILRMKMPAITLMQKPATEAEMAP